MSDAVECTGSMLQMSSDIQASIRFAYWSMVSSHGLGVAGGVARGRVCGRLELAVGNVSGGAMARRYADESIEVTPTIAHALRMYHDDPVEHSKGPIYLGSPMDACLTVLHETVHCCGKVIPADSSITYCLAGGRMAVHVDEMITELCARQILAEALGWTASSLFGSEANLGPYDCLIIPTARAVAAVCDCTEAQAVDRLAFAALQARRENPVSTDMIALGRLIELATTAEDPTPCSV